MTAPYPESIGKTPGSRTSRHEAWLACIVT
jgi:hypothetical protein